MTNLKREYFFLKRQLKKRFSLLLLAVVGCIILTLFSNITAKTYMYYALPEHHAENVDFMEYDDPSFVKRDGDTQTMSTLLYKYEYNGVSYKVSFVLLLNICAFFMYAMLVLTIISAVRYLDWFRRFTISETYEKADNRRVAMLTLKKALNTSD